MYLSLFSTFGRSTSALSLCDRYDPTWHCPIPANHYQQQQRWTVGSQTSPVWSSFELEIPVNKNGLGVQFHLIRALGGPDGCKIGLSRRRSVARKTCIALDLAEDWRSSYMYANRDEWHEASHRRYLVGKYNSASMPHSRLLEHEQLFLQPGRRGGATRWSRM